MADSIILSDGTTDYEFVYNAASQNDFKAHYGVRVEAGEPDVLWHRPDDSSPRLVRLNNQPRTVFLTKDVYGDDWDDIMNTLAPIKRWVDGDDQQAAQYDTAGNVNKIYLRIQLDGMTNYTDATVIYGNVDDSGSFYKPTDVLNKIATGVVVMLVVEPLGEGAAITLRNDLAVSSAFLLSSGGVAYGWSVFVNAPSITSVVTTRYLIGGQCQRMVCSNTAQTEGLQATAVTAAMGSTAVAYVWVHAGTPASDDILTIRLSDGSNNTIDTVTFNPASPPTNTKTAIGPLLQRTWYRMVVSGTNSAAADFSLRVYRNGGDAIAGGTYFLDGAYLQTGTTTAPDAWASRSTIKNRYDPAVTSAATRGQINYIDVWGVPGDNDAIIDHAIVGTTISGTPAVIIAGKDVQGTVNPAARIHWIDSVDVDVSLVGGTTATVADANRAGGSYLRYTADATFRNVNWLADIGTTWAQYTAFAQIPHRVYAIARTSNAATVLTLGSFFSFFAVVQGAGTFENTGTWELVDCGLVTSIDKTILDYRTEDTSYIQINAALTATSATAELDAVLLVPATEDGFLVGGDTTITTSTTQHLLGSEETYMSSAATRIGPTLGSVWTIKPGNIMTRYIYTMIASDNEHVLTNAFTNTLTITPRTRHLLGTT